MLAEEEIVINQNNDESFHILSVGRLSYVKGFDMAVKALRLYMIKVLLILSGLLLAMADMKKN